METDLDQEGCKPVTTADHELVRINQELLNILIGKVGLLIADAYPFIGQNMAAVLRQLDGVSRFFFLFLVLEMVKCDAG